MHEPVAKPECIVPLEKDSHTPCQMLSYTAAMLIHPTLRMQSWGGFVIGALLFALGSAPVISTQLGTVGANTSFFVGSWFFTAAAFVQLMLSGAATATDSGGTAIRGEWLASFIQFIGTLLFNVSTGAALYAHTVKGEMHLVWNPNVEGSLCFLVSSALAVLILWRCGQRWEPRSKEWQSGWLNMLGSIAFGGLRRRSFVLDDGNTLDRTSPMWAPSSAHCASWLPQRCFWARAKRSSRCLVGGLRRAAKSILLSPSRNAWFLHVPSGRATRFRSLGTLVDVRQ